MCNVLRPKPSVACALWGGFRSRSGAVDVRAKNCCDRGASDHHRWPWLTNARHIDGCYNREDDQGCTDPLALRSFGAVNLAHSFDVVRSTHLELSTVVSLNLDDVQQALGCTWKDGFILSRQGGRRKQAGKGLELHI